jgi:predicted AlkP superfamily phosphohydrolase/phosphomutase
VKNKKLLFIELDGATWDIISPLIEQGKLPNIKTLMQSGASGKLISSPPLISPKIWTSIFTGKTAQKTGIDFFGASSKNVTCKRIWDIFDEKGLKVGIFGSFVTWPPHPVNGFMIPGVDSLGTETYPPKYYVLQEPVLNEVRKRKGLGSKYSSLIDPIYYACKFKTMGVSLRTLFKALSYLAQEKAGKFDQKDRQPKKAILHLMISTEAFIHLHKLFNPDFATFHIHVCDFISHRFWEFYEPDKFPGVDSLEVRKYRNTIPNAYMRIYNMIRFWRFWA